ncbi:MAG: hypothetical protein GC201_05865 [Alphaproteobacteria bacterium]|nr:hypothetical protein [Alphaproteobacteria bacterium]
MNNEPHHEGFNRHPEDPPVLDAREARGGRMYEKSNKRRFLLLALLLIVLTAVSVFIYFGGGGQVPEGAKPVVNGPPATIPGDTSQ